MKICFVSLNNIYPLFRPIENRDIIGGTERQEKYMGKELQLLNFQVSYVVYDYGQPQQENIDNFIFYKTFPLNKRGIPLLSFFYPKIYKLWQAVKLANADVYYCRASGFETGVVAYFAKKYKKKIIYGGANSNDFLAYRDLPLNFRNKVIYYYGLKNSDLIICQTKEQIELLKKNYGLSGCLQPNITPALKTIPPLGKKIVSIAHIHKDKRPLFFLQLAKALPQYEFIMIGGVKGEQEKLYKEILEKLKEIKNLTYLGLLPFEEVEKWLKQAKVLVNTSLREGFPNTYLQAWRCGIPVVTTFDPKLDIEENKLGLKANNIDELIDKVKLVMEDKVVFDREHIKNYCSNHYGPKSVVEEMSKRIQTLIND